MRLFLNGTKVIDAWRDQGATPYTYTATLTAGTLYKIELQYYEHEGGASCRLQWSYPGQATQPIRKASSFRIDPGRRARASSPSRGECQVQALCRLAFLNPIKVQIDGVDRDPDLP